MWVAYDCITDGGNICSFLSIFADIELLNETLQCQRVYSFGSPCQFLLWYWMTSAILKCISKRIELAKMSKFCDLNCHNMHRRLYTIDRNDYALPKTNFKCLTLLKNYFWASNVWRKGLMLFRHICTYFFGVWFYSIH